MNIYIDYDDCLCETGQHFSLLVKELFDLDVPYEDIRSFNLQKSFSLTDEDYEKMMIMAHTPEVLLSYDETPGAVATIRDWISRGHEISVITGRPSSSYEASRQWLDEHNLADVKLYCLNKYGRDSFIKNSDFNLELEDYYKMKFDVAIEDSPAAFQFFGHLPDLKVFVIDRPWNQDCEFPGENFRRCNDWATIKRLVEE
jgi:uncharacterized HAD superfamily protein